MCSLLPASLSSGHAAWSASALESRTERRSLHDFIKHCAHRTAARPGGMCRRIARRKSPSRLSVMFKFSGNLQRIIELPPGINPSEQGPHAPDALAMQQQRHPGAGHFVWTRAVKDDFTVTAGISKMTTLHLVRIEMNGALDKRRFVLRVLRGN